MYGGVCLSDSDPDLDVYKRQVAECAEFLKSMMSAENNADWCEIAGKLPVRADAVELKDFWTADARFKVFNDSMDFAVARGPHESCLLYTSANSIIRIRIPSWASIAEIPALPSFPASA